MPKLPDKTLEYTAVIEAEDLHLRERRRKIMGDDFAAQLADNRFGIALSGGGIRSATINLGLLKTLNKFGVLKQADYLSTVSGGGYTGAYVQATLKKEGSLDCLFQDEHINYMRSRGEYLFPGTGWLKIWNQFTLVVAYFISLLMSLVSPALVVLLASGLVMFLMDVFGFNTAEQQTFALYRTVIYTYGFYALLVIVVLHYLVNITAVYNLYISAWFDRATATTLGLGLFALGLAFLLSFRELNAPDWMATLSYLGYAMVLFLLGLFTNPNAVSFHRFYRKQLADAFLHFSLEYRNMPLRELHCRDSDAPNDYLAPYPLINTCLNLQSSKDPNFQGAKASDYFLLSPHYCGAKLVGYVPTDIATGYGRMSLPAAVTISAAAVNPGLGAYSNKLLSIGLTLLNLRLGFWTWNPQHLLSKYPAVWWPSYFFHELLGRIGTDKKMVNISDGGHIENLGVMELLRRKCRLIISVDAGADPHFTFADLENLTIRARNELGVDIRFRRDQIPETVIRATPSHGYSKQRFAIADLYQIWEKNDLSDGKEEIIHYPNGKKVGLFVYVKSSVTAPEGRPQIDPQKEPLKYGTYKYKIYHPDFPHESTGDQFFDPIQWEAYYQLGQFIAGDILGVDNLNQFDVDHAFTIPLNELIAHFDHDVQLFGAMEVALPIQSRSLEEVAEPMVAEEYDQSPKTDYEM